VFDDLWELRGVHHNAPSWSLVNVSGSAAPPARRAHAAVAHATDDGRCGGGCLLVFGGLGAREEPMDDLWELARATRRWKPLHAVAGALYDGVPWPPPRQHHTLVALPPAVGGAAPAAALLFGGSALPPAAGASPLVDDGLWEWRFDRHRWVRLHSPAGAPRPAARVGHAAVGAGGSLWVLGGAPAAAARLEAWRFAWGGGAADACAAGCDAHGACDLRDGVCACDAPWAGRRCELERAPPPPYPLLRRAIKVALFFAVAAVVGALVGYARQRARHRYEESLLAAASGGGEKA